MVDADEFALPASVPGAELTGRRGMVQSAPFGTISAGKQVVTVACALMGWSIRESTGVAGAIVEILSGGGSDGELLVTLGLNSGFDPSAAQSPQAQSSSGANAVQTATITPGAGVTAFITTLRIEGLGATGATEVQATLTGVLGGTITYPVSVPAGATTPITPVTDSFGTRGLPGSAAGQAISLSLPAFGAGNTFEEASITGYLQTSAGSEKTGTAPGHGLLAPGGLFINVIQGSVKGALWFRI